MNRHFARIALLTGFSIFISCMSVAAAENATTRPDILIKISRLNQAITVIDDLAAADADQPMSAPSFLLRSVLFGTDWIDPARSIVIGIDFKNMTADEKPVMAALVPYTRPNEDFHLSYNAVSKINHYLIALPPGEGGAVSDQMAADLAEASQTLPDGLISMDLAAARLLTKADSQIRKMLLEIDGKMGEQQSSVDNLTTEDVNQLFSSLLDAAKQLETLSMGIDITKSELTIFSDAVALKGTNLAQLFNRNAESHFSRMGKYAPQHHINFKSVSYDVKGMIAFLESIAGGFYKKIGLDLAGMETMASRFTGEMAGGLSFSDSSYIDPGAVNQGMDIEMIAVLNDTQQAGAEFIASVYLPWMMEYGQKMTDFYNQQSPGEPIKNIFSKTHESTVDGYKVFGMAFEIPFVDPETGATDKIKFDLRTTAVDNLLLTASTDDRLKRLISIAPTLERQPYDGPLMRMDMDLGAYIGAVQKMIPRAESHKNLNLPDLGALVYTFDMANNKLSTKYVVQIDDIRSMVAAFKQAGADDEHSSGQSADESFAQSAPTLLQHQENAQKPQPKKEDTADFWIDKGLLYATYGNDKEAIKFYKKALRLAPDNPRVHFSLGLSYSSLGNYDMAITALNQAIFLAPDNGDYHYGLGWVYLLKGESGKAMDYIHTAADLGNPDARKYLMKHPAKMMK